MRGDGGGGDACECVNVCVLRFNVDGKRNSAATGAYRACVLCPVLLSDHDGRARCAPRRCTTQEGGGWQPMASRGDQAQVPPESFSWTMTRGGGEEDSGERPRRAPVEIEHVRPTDPVCRSRWGSSLGDPPPPQRRICSVRGSGSC